MLKKAIFFSVCTFAATSSFAMQITNGKLISSKESILGNGQATFAEIKAVKLPAALAKLTKTATNTGFQSLFAQAHIDYNPFILIGSNDKDSQKITIKGSMNVEIANHHANDEIYKIRTSVCYIAISKPDIQCAYKFDEMMLSSGGSMSVNRLPSLELEMQNDPYPYYQSIQVEIMNQNSDIEFASGDTTFVNSPFIIQAIPLPKN